MTSMAPLFCVAVPPLTKVVSARSVTLWPAPVNRLTYSSRSARLTAPSSPLSSAPSHTKKILEASALLDMALESRSMLVASRHASLLERWVVLVCIQVVLGLSAFAADPW